MTDGHRNNSAAKRKLIWDEENRLLAVDENGFVSNYWYDANGERTVKTSGENEAIYVNSEFSGGNTGTARFSLYVSPYLVAGQGGKYTKHIYIGSQRIVSKLGDLASYGADPRRIPYAGNEADGLTINYKDKYAQQLQSIKDNYKTFDIPYTGKDNNDYVNGQGFCCDDGTPEATQARSMARASIDGNFKPNEEYEKMQFYYHPDHLGSSSYITNLDGEVSQHIEYVPFGEVFIEERNNMWNTPYLFNAKELDEETGMYYYGARYYEPKLSLWMSCDPLQERYPDRFAYCFTANNPIRYVDLTGKSETDFLNSETNEHVYVNDGKNQVLEITNADFQILKSIEFNSNDDRYKEIVSRGSLREDLYYTVENVLKGRKFISYSSTQNCFESATKQNNVTPLGADQRMDVLLLKGNSFLSNNLDKGINYLKLQLKQGNSVVVGVYTGDYHNNHNVLTGHFVNVVGMGFDENGNYFSYYDNADSRIGTNIQDNRFYKGPLEENNVLFDKTRLGVGNVKLYMVTEIRRNKSR